jgi:putative ABC transport system ATP-binding protein
MLELKNITKTFNTTGNPLDLRVALDNINLKINKGEFVTIIGGNGSGKSTLLNVIAGVVLPDEGEVIIEGTNITNLPEHKRSKFLGRVCQDPSQGTAGNMSIEENMALAMRRDQKKTLKWGFVKSDRKYFINKLSELNLGLEDRLNQKVGLLSGGQRQAVTLIMATLKEPKLLLLDEHTAALDPKTALTVLTLTNDIVSNHEITTIMITHNMRDALKYGNRLLMLNNGKIVLDIKGEEKKKLTIEQLLTKFEMDENIELSDKMLLSK